MATWPGMEADTPKLKRDGTTEYIIRTRMPSPCNRNFKGTASDKNPQTAYNRAHAILKRNVRVHLNRCEKCPEGTYRP